MSEKELREVLKKIVHQELKNELDSSRIFAYVENLEQRIDKAIEYIENHSLYEEEYDYDYEENSYLSGINDEVAKKELLEILKRNSISD